MMVSRTSTPKVLKMVTLTQSEENRAIGMRCNRGITRDAIIEKTTLKKARKLHGTWYNSVEEMKQAVIASQGTVAVAPASKSRAKPKHVSRFVDDVRTTKCLEDNGFHFNIRLDSPYGSVEESHKRFVEKMQRISTNDSYTLRVVEVNPALDTMAEDIHIPVYIPATMDEINRRMQASHCEWRYSKTGGSGLIASSGVAGETFNEIRRFESVSNVTFENIGLKRPQFMWTPSNALLRVDFQTTVMRQDGVDVQYVDAGKLLFPISRTMDWWRVFPRLNVGQIKSTMVVIRNFPVIAGSVRNSVSKGVYWIKDKHGFHFSEERNNVTYVYTTWNCQSMRDYDDALIHESEEDIMQRWVKNALSVSEQDLKNKTKEKEKLEKQLMTKAYEYGKALNMHQRLVASSQGMFGEMLDAIRNVPSVTKVALQGNLLVVHTEKLYFTHSSGKTYYMGEYEILFEPFLGSVTFQNIHCSSPHRYAHPHADTTICSGNYPAMVTQAFTMLDYGLLFHILIGMLSTMTEGDYGAKKKLLTYSEEPPESREVSARISLVGTTLSPPDSGRFGGALIQITADDIEVDPEIEDHSEESDDYDEED